MHQILGLRPKRPGPAGVRAWILRRVVWVPVAAFTEGALNAMLLHNTKIAAVVILVAALAIGGVGVLIHAPLSAGTNEPGQRSATATPEKTAPDYRAGSLAKEGPQGVYATDPTDPWNRIFYCLFTRTVQTRLADDFPEGKPFDIKVRGLSVSRRLFQRIEPGDRAIEPFYPSHFVRYGKAPFERWVALRYAPLKQALQDALRERADRAPLARALMQSDVWAAYDRLSAYEARRREDQERRQEILSLLGRFARKLALTPAEIKALPDNYAAAADVHDLPDVFAAESPWLEVVWYPERFHEEFADFRRVARVFLKPVAPPADKRAFLNGLRQARHVAERLDGVALVIQDLLIDRAGQVVPTPLTSEVEVRCFRKDRAGKVARAEIEQYERSRRRLLGTPKAGGLEAIDRTAPLYLASAGNDLDFASDSHEAVEQPVLVRLETRCTACHGKNTEAVFTFEGRPSGPPPPVTLLKPSDNEHARHVVGRKGEQRDFKALQAHWKVEKN
jgi:hypothetical protein